MINKKIEIYSRPGCTWCDKAKTYLKNKATPFVEHIVGKDIIVEDVKVMFPGVTTLPIIVLDSVLIGGYAQLIERIK